MHLDKRSMRRISATCWHGWTQRGAERFGGRCDGCQRTVAPACPVGFLVVAARVMCVSAFAPVPSTSYADCDRETSRPGLFAVGDLRSKSVKRVASAVGEGSAAVRAVHQHLAFIS